ncbi:MAG: hypothetical protein Ta2B_16250 [Termitinemataceae bacterium]|nr:MAG: hypothetical protein Ta2B_16250 [Termitinemataceae bacterium]
MRKTTKNGWSKMLLLVMAALVLSLGLIFVGCSKSGDSSAKKNTTFAVDESNQTQQILVSETTSVPEITAVQLYQEYEASPPKADRAYKGKQIKVSGTVASVEEGYDNNFKKRYYISLETAPNNEYHHWLQVFFDEKDIESIYDVSKGQKITILGVLIQKGIAYIVIDHSKIVK